VQVPYDEGVANRIGPESCAVVREGPDRRGQRPWYPPCAGTGVVPPHGDFNNLDWTVSIYGPFADFDPPQSFALKI
jgi:hypothetical protein